MSPVSILFFMLYAIWSLTSFGALNDRRSAIQFNQYEYVQDTGTLSEDKIFSGIHIHTFLLLVSGGLPHTWS